MSSDCLGKFTPQERGRALGLTSTAFHIGFLTGHHWALSDRHDRWRWIFYINMPFSLYGAYLAWKVIPRPEQKRKSPSTFQERSCCF